ncbi:proteasome regulatory particle lid subunit [Saccharomycopsis crataegensis]|uniref:Proteasome regulatory particle lid subunit n=1 Tax=Saccharomycopsis crataegensis TaxID=43959 RepID=A0AAV5QVT5_9ASCO|nr:proteasome regulatory particle lid subunit [Saccharomycopsis crataegensis]
MSLEKTSQQLKDAFAKQDFQTCVKLLSLIKVQLAQHNLLVPILNNKINQGDLLISRSLLEIGALAAINVSNLKLFEKLIIELKPFYNLKTEFFLNNKSALENKLEALYLLLLLTKGEISQFHIELLSLSSSINGFNSNTVDDMSQIENDKYLNYPIKIERWLMEGSYDKVWDLINNTGSTSADFKEFLSFNNSLTNTLRNEISKCLNVSYDSLPISNAKNLLFFDNERALSSYIKNNSGVTTTWKIENGVIFFPKKEEEEEEGGDAIDVDDYYNEQGFGDESQFDRPQQKLSINESIIKNVLGYATEMETIV